MRDSVLALVLFAPLLGGCGTIANVGGLSERDDRGKMGGGYRLDTIAFQNAISAPDLLIATGERREPHPRGPFDWLGIRRLSQRTGRVQPSDSFCQISRIRWSFLLIDRGA